MENKLRVVQNEFVSKNTVYLYHGFKKSLTLSLRQNEEE